MVMQAVQAACSEATVASLLELIGNAGVESICSAPNALGCEDAEKCAIRYLAGELSLSRGAASRSLIPEGAIRVIDGYPVPDPADVGNFADAASAGINSAKNVAAGLDTMFLMFSGFLVFFMQLGFAMLCAGLVRYKNANNIMLKNLLDAAIGSVAWFVLGYGFAYGSDPDHHDNAFIGHYDFALSHTTDVNWGRLDSFPGGGFAGYFFQWTFAAAAATITSGAVAERISFGAYFGYSIFMAAWVYPVIVHAVWSGPGWLSAFSTSFNYGEPAIASTGAYDFAGSGVVHLTGGMGALIGAIFTGPRLGRFKDGKVVDQMTGTSTVLVVLGTLILWFGWYGFNPGSQLAISSPSDAAVACRCAVTTTISAGTAGTTMLFFRYWRSRNWEVVYTCNGILAGLVGITAGCSVTEPWAALLCGFFAALVMYGAEAALFRLHIDDCVSAFPVHGAAGIYGVLWNGFMAKHDYAQQVYGGPYPNFRRYYGRYGWFYGGYGQVMLCNFIEVLFIITWVTVNMSLLFGLLKYFNRLRVPPEMEHQGLDSSYHGSKQGAAPQNGGFVDLTVAPVGGQNGGAK